MQKRPLPSTAALAFGMLVFCLSTAASAVAPVGSQIRIDVDPGTGFYGFGNYLVAKTNDGGFAIAWEENRVADPEGTTKYEALKYRIFKSNLTPVGPPKAADISAKTFPGIVKFVPLGPGKLSLIYSATQPSSAIDNPGTRQAFGQTIQIGNGNATARVLLNNTKNANDMVPRASSLSDGREIFAWYDNGKYAHIPARFISPAGVPQAVKLDLQLKGDSQLIALSSVGTGFLGYYRRVSLFQNFNETYGRVFKADGSAFGPAKKLPMPDNFAPSVIGTPGGRILVLQVSKSGSGYKQTGQFFDRSWAPLTAAKILIPQSPSPPVATIGLLSDGGILFSITVDSTGKSTHTIRRFNSNLVAGGAAYSFASAPGDRAHLLVLNATRAVAVVRTKVGGRDRIVGQPLSY